MSKKLPIITITSALRSAQESLNPRFLTTNYDVEFELELHELIAKQEEQEERIRLARAELVTKIMVDARLYEGVQEKVQPPALAEALIPVLIKGKRADAILGDLEERFVRDCAALGERRARNLYRARVANSIGPLLWSAIKKIGVFALLAAAVRKLVGG